MRVESSAKLNEHEQKCLIRAIESAIEVGQQEQFQAWMRGPFRELLSYQSAVCIALGRRGEVHKVDCLHHSSLDAASMDSLCNPEHGLAVLLARSFRNKAQFSCTVDAAALQALLQGKPHGFTPLSNAVMHRTKFLSGASYFFILINVPEDQLERSPILFKLLSSHLKMALSRAVAAETQADASSLTPRELEILRWMGAGKSNREISVLLHISPITLKSHISKIYRKLNVQNRVDAVAQGRKHQERLHEDAKGPLDFGHPLASA